MANDLLPPPPPTQALGSKTFRLPPLDGSLTLPEIYDWHLTNTPEHRLFVYCDSEQNTRTIYWPEAVKAIYNGSQFLRDIIGWTPGSTSGRNIVAILAAADTITYFTMIMAIMRAGYIAFPISPRNSASAVAHLIKSVGVQYILVGRDKSMIELTDESLRALPAEYAENNKMPQLIPIPVFEELFTIRVDVDVQAFPPSNRRGPNDIVLYLHSSGSTAYPKPIPWTNQKFLQLALIPFFGERDLTDQVFSLHSMPMYHGMGFVQCCWTASFGLVVSVFEPKSPAQIPTPDNHFKAAVATQSDIIFCVPAVIEAWSRNAEYIKWFSTRTGVLFGGGPLNKAAGDYMTSQGVSIFLMYGSSEGGVMSTILPAHVGYDWDYFRFSDVVKAEMVPYGDNTYEFIMVSNVFCYPSVINTEVNGVDSYATSDLMTPHPTKPGYWRIYGRTDDQIMHSTGEKTNPGPLENMLIQDPHVQAAVMFGRGKFQAGVIIDPKPAFKFDPSNEQELESFRNKIWPTIQRMNNFAPQHSRLFKEMILVAKPDKPFQYTAKSTPRRQAIIIQYEDEIEAVYLAVEATTQANIPLPTDWDIISSTDFARAVVNSVLVHKVNDDDDIFQNGCDSLQATWIRNALTRALRLGLNMDTRRNTDNFVYNYPTVSSLATFLIAHNSGDSTGGPSDNDKKRQMISMAEKYSADFPKFSGQIPAKSTQKTVLLTGSTGALGAFVLNCLVDDAGVERVYCINRPGLGSVSLLDRQRASLLEKGLSVDILQSGKVFLVEAVLDETQWSLDASLYKEVQESVTHIIHNAWPVDFNLSLTSFESNIKGLRSLIDFGLSSPLVIPPTLIFTSTIGVFQSHPLTLNDIPEVSIEANVAIGIGYTESKWVSEQILTAASKETSLQTIIARVGQIAGGPNGYWNVKEWFPALIQSAKFVSCLPTQANNVSWLPIQDVAKALVDFMQHSEATIAHVIHPRSTSWPKIANVLSSELSVPLVPYHEWLSKLEHLAISLDVKVADSTTQVAALRLLWFYRATALKIGELGRLGEGFGFHRLSASNAVSMSSTLAEMPELGEIGAKLWLNYWRTVGFI